MNKIVPSLFIALSVLQICSCLPFSSHDASTETYNWIIVGGGAAGCAAAATLAEAGETVLLIERGKSDIDPAMAETQTAGAWPAVINTGAAELIRFKEGTWGAAGKVLGGGTSVNGGLFFQETPDFFERMFAGDVDQALPAKSEKPHPTAGAEPSPPSRRRRWTRATSGSRRSSRRRSRRRPSARRFTARSCRRASRAAARGSCAR